MPLNRLHKAAFGVYDFTWRVALPWLNLNQRLAEGFDQRAFKDKSPDQAGLWIQAASVGESFLALEILKTLEVKQLTRILLTANTRQGIDIFASAFLDRPDDAKRLLQKNPELARATLVGGATPLHDAATSPPRVLDVRSRRATDR